MESARRAQYKARSKTEKHRAEKHRSRKAQKQESRKTQKQESRKAQKQKKQQDASQPNLSTSKTLYRKTPTQNPNTKHQANPLSHNSNSKIKSTRPNHLSPSKNLYRETPVPKKQRVQYGRPRNPMISNLKLGIILSVSNLKKLLHMSVGSLNQFVVRRSGPTNLIGKGWHRVSIRLGPIYPPCCSCHFLCSLSHKSVSIAYLISRAC